MADFNLNTFEIYEIFKEGFATPREYKIALFNSNFPIVLNTDIEYQGYKIYEISGGSYDAGGKVIIIGFIKPQNLPSGFLFEITARGEETDESIGSISFSRDSNFPSFSFWGIYNIKTSRFLAYGGIDKEEDFADGANEFSMRFNPFMRLSEKGG